MNESSKNPVVGAEEKFNSCLFYSSAVSPTTVDSLLARKYCFKNHKKQHQRKVVNTRVFRKDPGTSSNWEKCELQNKPNQRCQNIEQ